MFKSIDVLRTADLTYIIRWPCQVSLNTDPVSLIFQAHSI